MQGQQSRGRFLPTRGRKGWGNFLVLLKEQSGKRFLWTGTGRKRSTLRKLNFWTKKRLNLRGKN